MIADDHHLVREGIRALLEKPRDIEVVGEAENGREVVGLAQTLKPDVLVMDISMPELNGIQALKSLYGRGLGIETVILSMHTDDVLVRKAVQYGAKCYLPKGAVFDELLFAIRAASRGAAYFSPAISQYLSGHSCATSAEDSGSEPNGLRLTPRELQVLQLISHGKTNNEMSAVLKISVKTVERHRTHLMAKLKARNLVELIRAAVKRNLIDLET